jgi:predicted HTH transcriptional regulator
MISHINSAFIGAMKSHNDKILSFIKKSKVVTSYEVAEFLGISWNTADSWLKELLIDSKIERIKKKGGLNLWLMK